MKWSIKSSQAYRLMLSFIAYQIAGLAAIEIAKLTFADFSRGDMHFVHFYVFMLYLVFWGSGGGLAAALNRKPIFP